MQLECGPGGVQGAAAGAVGQSDDRASGGGGGGGGDVAPRHAAPDAARPTQAPQGGPQEEGAGGHYWVEDVRRAGAARLPRETIRE